MKNIEIHPTIGFSKKGDDFHHCLKQTSSVCGALKMYAEGFEENAKILHALAEELKNIPVKAQGDTHWIWISCPEDVANKLIEKNLAYKNVFDEEDEEEEEEN